VKQLSGTNGLAPNIPSSICSIITTTVHNLSNHQHRILRACKQPNHPPVQYRLLVFPAPAGSQHRILRQIKLLEEKQVLLRSIFTSILRLRTRRDKHQSSRGSEGREFVSISMLKLIALNCKIYWHKVQSAHLQTLASPE